METGQAGPQLCSMKHVVKASHRSPVMVVANRGGSTQIIISKQDIDVVNSKDPSAGDLTGQNHRGHETAWSPGTFCRGSGNLSGSFPPCLPETLTPVWLPGFFRAAILHNSEECDSYHSRRPWVQDCCLIPGLHLFALSLRIRQLSS